MNRILVGLLSAALLLTYAPTSFAAPNEQETTDSSVESTNSSGGSYWFFVITFGENDVRVTNSFYTTGTHLEVYGKVRKALGGFTGELLGTGDFSSLEAAEQERAIHAGLPSITVPEIK
jgi:hypothetical protein